jgi:hypothetical protein
LPPKKPNFFGLSHSNKTDQKIFYKGCLMSNHDHFVIYALQAMEALIESGRMQLDSSKDALVGENHSHSPAMARIFTVASVVSRLDLRMGATPSV